MANFMTTICGGISIRNTLEQSHDPTINKTEEISMSQNRTIKSEKITVLRKGKRPSTGTLFTSYTGTFFLKKVGQWVEL